MSDDLELVDQYLRVLKQYVDEAPVLAKKLECFGRLRHELQGLVAELKKRNIELPEIDAPSITTD